MAQVAQILVQTLLAVQSIYKQKQWINWNRKKCHLTYGTMDIYSSILSYHIYICLAKEMKQQDRFASLN